MQKFSKKLVSKVIYVKILLASEHDLIEHFLKEKGWDLLNTWFEDAIKSLNWALCAELTLLFTKCPMTAQRLKENVELNQAPKLIRQLSCDPRVDATVKRTASQVLTKWMAVVAPSTGPLAMAPMTSGRTTRGSRAQATPVRDPSEPRVPVMVQTDIDEITNLASLVTVSAQNSRDNVEESEGQVWVGKGASARGARLAKRRGAPGQVARKTPTPGRSAEMVESGGEDSDDDDYKPPEDDPFDNLMTSSIKNEKQKVKNTVKLIGVIRNETLDEVEPEPVRLLKGLANELSETLKKEAVIIKKEESVEKSKEREARREKERRERKERERRDEKKRDERGEKKEEKKDRDKHKYSDKEREKHREERRRKEKERERQKEKERKELKEKKRESKPYRETEMRDKLDSSQKTKIKELAQKLRDESKPSSIMTGLPKIPKIPKPEPKTLKKPGPSFEDLMFGLDSSKALPPIKPAPIKNKSRDLMAALMEDSPLPTKPTSKLDKSITKPRVLSTEDKSSKVDKQDGASSPIQKIEDKPKVSMSSDPMTVEKKTDENKDDKEKKEDEKKVLKRTSSDNEVPKLKIKSPAQLKEGNMFGDFLSTIMPEQPKKKKIKLSDFKTQKEVKVAAENSEKPESETKDDSLEKSLADAASTFSFYRDTMSGESTSGSSPEPADNGPKSPDKKEPEPDTSDSEMPFVEPQSTLPREVRGILVLAKGPKRTRRIQWRPQETLVEIEYFELDETERVNVNKVKFEEAKKAGEMEEKKKMHQKPSAQDDQRPWTGMKVLECELPEIDYGGNSNEKKEQEQRENKVLQILFFNNKRPDDPSEPDAAGGVKVVTKPIPLEDNSGDEAYTDYSGEPWPVPVQEKENTPVFDNIMNNIQPNLINNISMTINKNAELDMESPVAAAALYAAQKAAEYELRKHGALPQMVEDEDLPMEQDVPIMNPSVPPPMVGQDHPAEYPPKGPQGDIGFYQQPPPGPWSSGPPPFHGGPPPRGGHYNGKGPQYHDFNQGGFRGRGGGGPVRGFHGNQNAQHNNGYHNDRHHDNRGGWDRRDDRGKKEYPRPCKFWMEKGYCREENMCRFPHPQGR